MDVSLYIDDLPGHMYGVYLEYLPGIATLSVLLGRKAYCLTFLRQYGQPIRLYQESKEGSDVSAFQRYDEAAER